MLGFGHDEIILTIFLVLAKIMMTYYVFTGLMTKIRPKFTIVV